jgi:hypothetical protein
LYRSALQDCPDARAAWPGVDDTFMKRVVVDHYGGPEVLTVVEADDPRPGPGEVRVKVLAAGVAYTGAMLRAGTYLGVPKPPFTPGYELVGVVEGLRAGLLVIEHHWKRLRQANLTSDDPDRRVSTRRSQVQILPPLLRSLVTGASLSIRRSRSSF